MNPQDNKTPDSVVYRSVWITSIPKAVTPINPEIPKNDDGSVKYEVTFADQIIAGLYNREGKKPTLSLCKKTISNLSTINAKNRKWIEAQLSYQLRMWNAPSMEVREDD